MNRMDTMKKWRKEVHLFILFILFILSNSSPVFSLTTSPACR